MSRRAWCFLLAVAVSSLISCVHSPPITEKQAELLKVSGETNEVPLLPGASVADNSWCYVCHINFAEEKLAVSHAKAGTGCTACHGESYAHRGDEANITPPDIMYPKEKINPSCMKCHPSERLSGLHLPLLTGPIGDKEYCTDCHGTHRLGYRTQRWDKGTGKPIQGK